MSGLPAGKKLCPGWTSEFMPETSVNKEGYAERYLATKASGLDVKVPCGMAFGSRGRAGEQSVINETADMCSSCLRRKRKYDEENGARQKRQQDDEARYRSLIAAYAVDLQAFVGEANPSIESLIKNVDRLVPRATWPPHDTGVRALYGRRLGEAVSAADKMNVLRAFVGQPIAPKQVWER